jgi:hypothetical protein
LKMIAFAAGLLLLLYSLSSCLQKQPIVNDG